MTNAKSQMFQRYGFNPQGYIWCVVGDTYPIKDWLKSSGFRYDPLLHWYADRELPLPQDFTIVRLSFDDIYVYDDSYTLVEYKTNIRQELKEIFKRAAGGSDSNYVGSIGDRLKGLTATLKHHRSFVNKYGLNNVYTFESQNNLLVWFTKVNIPKIKKGSVVDLTGTIKKHELYNNVKTTILTRCIVTVID